MNFTFDPAKDEINVAKHGVSLALTAEFEWDTAVVWPDTRKDYGEARVACRHSRPAARAGRRA